MNHLKLIKLLIVISALYPFEFVYAKDNFVQAIKNTEYSGLLRFIYIDHKPDVSTKKETTASAIAIQAKAETARWKNFQIAIAPYFIEKLSALSGDESQGKLNSDFYDSNNNSFSYLAEAYITYNFDAGKIRLGRQQLLNPFINIDDFRAHPNTFNAIWFDYKFKNTLYLEIGKVTGWAGLDSGANQDVFKKASNDGVTAVGFHYEINDQQHVQAWNYNFDEQYNLFYLDTNFESKEFDFSLQYASYDEINSSAINGHVYGAFSSLEFDKVTMSAAINKTSSDSANSIDLGLGGGNFYTSMDEMTVSGFTDITAYTLNIAYSITNNFLISVASGYFKDDALTVDIHESDLILNYSVNDFTDIEFTYTQVENSVNKNDADTNFDRYFLRLNYRL